MGGRFRGLYDNGAARDRGRRRRSYLFRRRLGRRRRLAGHRGYFGAAQSHRAVEGRRLFGRRHREDVERQYSAGLGGAGEISGISPGPAWDRSPADRKSVVSGKSVSVRVDLGGGRSIKKKK